MKDEEKKNGREDLDPKKNGKPDDKRKPIKNGRGRHQKGDEKGRDRNPGREDKKDDGKKGIPWKNDWTFYALSEQIARDIASLPYSTVPGVPYTLDVQSPTVQRNVSQAGPGVMRIAYVPGPGSSTSNNSGINMAAKQLYTFVRHANSGARNYEAADLMMYVLAMRDIYTQFFQLKRCIGMASNYYMMNRNLPDALFHALLIDPADIRANLAQYRAQINLIAAKINAFAVPKYFKAFDRAAYISSYFFFDSTSRRSQAYIYQSLGYYTWSGTSSEQGTSLVFTPYQAATVADLKIGKLSDYIGYLNDQLDALFLDQDAGTMSGDILKAFGEGGLYQVADIPTDYVVLGVYDEDVLAQIENSKGVLGALDSTYNYAFNTFAAETATGRIGMNITQANQLIIFNPTWTPFSSTVGIVPTQVIFNSHKDEPQFTDNLEWSRDICMPYYSSLLVGTKPSLMFGLELLGFYDIVTFAPTGQGGDFVTQSGQRAYSHQIAVNDYYLELNNASSTTTNAGLLTRIIRLNSAFAQFDWHPTVYSWGYNTSSGSITSLVGVYVHADLKVYTVVPKDIVQTMHDNASMAADG